MPAALRVVSVSRRNRIAKAEEGTKFNRNTVMLIEASPWTRLRRDSMYAPYVQRAMGTENARLTAWKSGSLRTSSRAGSVSATRNPDFRA